MSDRVEHGPSETPVVEERCNYCVFTAEQHRGHGHAYSPFAGPEWLPARVSWLEGLVREARAERDAARAEADIARRTVPCPYCEDAEEDCPACLGTGHVLMCSRCNGMGGIGPEGDRNCPECSGDGLDEQGTAERVRRAVGGPSRDS